MAKKSLMTVKSDLKNYITDKNQKNIKQIKQFV